jgi:hypothetical protein
LICLFCDDMFAQAVTWLICIRKNSGENFCPNTGSPDLELLQSLQSNTNKLLSINHDQIFLNFSLSKYETMEAFYFCLSNLWSSYGFFK